MISQRMGRLLSAVGALLLIGGLFLTWYHIERSPGFIDTATGYETFTRLRVVILAGAVVLLLTAIVAQTQPVVILRTLVGVVLGVLILRRVAFPPEVSGHVSSQLGVFVGLLGALCAVVGGIVDTTREVTDRYPEMAFWRPLPSELTAAPARNGTIVDATAEEIH